MGKAKQQFLGLSVGVGLEGEAGGCSEASRGISSYQNSCSLRFTHGVPQPSHLSPQPISGEGGPIGSMPVPADTPIWLNSETAPRSLIVQPGSRWWSARALIGWGVSLSPLPCKLRGRTVLYEVGAGEAGASFQSPSEGTFHGPASVVLQCIPRLALPEDASAIEKEMEQQAKELSRRMTLRYSQADVGFAVGAFWGGKMLSQTTICPLKTQQLSLANMWKLRPLLKMWLEEMDTKNLLGLYRMEIIQQACKWRLASRERRIGNNLEKLFLQCPKPKTQQVSRIAGQLRLQMDPVQVWFYNGSKTGSLPPNAFSPLEVVGVTRPPFPGGTVDFIIGPAFWSPQQCSTLCSSAPSLRQEPSSLSGAPLLQVWGNGTGSPWPEPLPGSASTPVQQQLSLSCRASAQGRPAVCHQSAITREVRMAVLLEKGSHARENEGSPPFEVRETEPSSVSKEDIRNRRQGHLKSRD
ncbi:LOW QUALITY PROTEIN: POU domain, class 5, transcription factor 2 [Rhynchonycteris naso]